MSILYPLASEILPIHLQKAGVMLAGEDSTKAVTATNLFVSNETQTNGRSFVPMTLEEVERQYMRYALEFCNWKVRVAARLLGISHTKLYQKIKDYNLSHQELSDSE